MKRDGLIKNLGRPNRRDGNTLLALTRRLSALEIAKTDDLVFVLVLVFVFLLFSFLFSFSHRPWLGSSHTIINGILIECPPFRRGFAKPETNACFGGPTSRRARRRDFCDFGRFPGSAGGFGVRFWRTRSENGQYTQTRIDPAVFLDIFSRGCVNCTLEIGGYILL